ILEPKAKAVLYAKQAGFVDSVPVNIRNGQRLQKGDVILVCRDEELQSRLAELRARLNAAKLRQAAAQSSENQAQARVEEYTVRSTAHELADVQRRVNELTIKAPIDGYLVAPEIDQLPGKYFQVGEEICIV